MVKAITGAAAVAVMVSACGGQDSATTAQDVKENYVEMAYAAYGDSLSTVQALSASVDAFLADPTESKLSAARDAYKSIRAPYQQSEVMRWDTAITLSKGLDEDGGPASVDEWEGQVNAWPLDENHIVSIIEGDDDITVDALIDQNGADDNEANVTTGVHAVEFMLWGEDTHGTGAGAGERPASDFATSDCADDFCARRADYLSAAVDLLEADLVEMQAEWSPTAAETTGTLANNFLNDDAGIDYIFTAMRTMAVEELAGARMSSGLELGDPEESHDCFSDLSHVAIFNNFIGIKNAFFGRYTTVDGRVVSGASLADMLLERDVVTYVELKDALQEIEDLMQQIYDAGERTSDTVRFDQIIGQDESGVERQIAEQAVDRLVQVDDLFVAAIEALSLTASTIDGSGD